IDPLSTNLIRPVILANSVSSLPRPTFSPGFTRVPRCRTMIVPPGTSCPPKALKPSRCAFESRPFREVPCPFLCAINQFPVLSGQLPVIHISDNSQPIVILSGAGPRAERLARRSRRTPTSFSLSPLSSPPVSCVGLLSLPSSPAAQRSLLPRRPRVP